MSFNHEKFCEKFQFEELTEEFLINLTRTNAFDIQLILNNNDAYFNWITGKKLAAFAIIDCYSRECQEKQDCTPLPTFCESYLNEINIQELKELKAYFLWECDGSIENISEEFMNKYYFNACNKLLPFCEEIKTGEKQDCVYFDKILRKIDFRKNQLDRRVKSTNPNNDNRRNSKDRRKAEDFRRFFNKLLQLNGHKMS